MLSSARMRAIVVSALLCTVPLVAAAQQAAVRDNAKAAESAPTPQTADGHPDLSGLWTGGGGGGGGQLSATNPDYLKTDANGYDPSIIATRGGTFTNFERDNTLVRRMVSNKPY